MISWAELAAPPSQLRGNCQGRRDLRCWRCRSERRSCCCREHIDGLAQQISADSALRPQYCLPPKHVVYVGAVGDDDLAKQLEAANEKVREQPRYSNESSDPPRAFSGRRPVRLPAPPGSEDRCLRRRHHRSRSVSTIALAYELFPGAYALHDLAPCAPRSVPPSPLPRTTSPSPRSRR